MLHEGWGRLGVVQVRTTCCTEAARVVSPDVLRARYVLLQCLSILRKASHVEGFLTVSRVQERQRGVKTEHSSLSPLSMQHEDFGEAEQSRQMRQAEE